MLGDEIAHYMEQCGELVRQNMELKAQVEGLRGTNQRLNRRCQRLESAIKSNNAWSEGWKAGCAGESERQDRQWQRIAQKHGEKNAKLKKEIEGLRAAEAKGRGDD